MKYKFRKYLAIVTIIVCLLLQFSLNVGTSSHIGKYNFLLAANCSSQSCTQAQQGATVLDNGSGLDIHKLIGTIINILAWIIGITSVIVVIFGGFRYVISGGDANSINSARNTIIYALVGLSIAALAQVLLHFVLKRFFY